MSSNLKRQRPEANEPDSQELPTKKSELEGESSLLRPAAPLPASRSSAGLFRRSFLPSVDLSQSEALQKLKEQQEAEKAKTPLVLLDPKSQFQPKDAEKFSASIANGTKSSETATTFGKFDKEVSEKEDQKDEEKKDEEDKSENGEEKPAETKKVEENTEEKVEPTPRKPEPKKLNPFQKVANESAKSGGFGGLSITKSASDSTGLNPFQRLAQKSTSGGATSAWSGFAQKKEESVEIKEEAEKEENDAEKTSEKPKEPAEKIVTGEEEEKNVLQVPCKLFQFDKQESTYSQRGRGTLRVNDCGEGSDFKSRLVFRTSGTQKVAMNSKIWASMSVEQVGPKSIRISAQDANTEGGVGIFLVQTALHDSKELYRAIDSRIIKMKTTESSK
jgi:Ran-binding protein 3